MTVTKAGLAAMGAMVAMGGAGVYFTLRRVLLGEADRRQRAMELRLRAMEATLRGLEEKLAAIEPVCIPLMTQAPETEPAIFAEGVEDAPAALAAPGVTAQTMAVLEAAAAAFLGKKVRVISAKTMLKPRQGISAWSQQGRVFVQASHNLR